MPAATDEMLTEVLQLLAEHAGMASESLSAAGITHAIRKRMSATQAASPQDYLRFLAGQTEFQELIEELVVPETWFFRDPMAFRCVVQRLKAYRAESRDTVRILSIGCSTGEEVYSLAMLVRDAGLAATQCLIAGTDISRQSIDFARRAIYPPRSFRATDDGFAAGCRRWCERIGESWRVRDEARTGVEFRWGNISQSDFLAGEPPYDLIFCRNVLIYFHAKARAAVLDNVRRLLAPEGMVCSAPAEARIFSEAGFRSFGHECPFAFRRGDELANKDVPCKPKTSPIESRPILAPKAARSSPMPNAASQPARWSPTNIEQRPPLSSVATAEADNLPDLRAAVQAADGGRLEEADALCGQILAREPANAEAHYLRGIVRKAQGALGEAQKSLESAVYLNSRHHEALVQMMLLAQQRGDQQAAANYRRRAEQAAPQEVK